MLGGRGRSAYFPGALVEPGAYAQERELFRSLGISNVEMPLDIVATVLTIPLSFWLIPERILYWPLSLNNYLLKLQGLPPQPKPHILGTVLIEFAAFILLNALALVRRTRLQRR